MSSFRLWILFVVTVIEMTIFSAPLLGWSSLVFVLKGEGVYSHLCPGEDENYNISIPTTHRESSAQRDEMCVEQEDRLNLGLTLTVLIGAVYIIICGWAIDRFGMKVMKIFSSVMYGISAGLFTITTSETSAILIPALLVFTIAQVGIYVSGLRSIVLFGKKWRSFANSLFSCAVGSSAVLFLIFKVLYEYGVSYQLLCYGFISATLVLLFNSIVIFPNTKNNNHNTETTKQQDKKQMTPESSNKSCLVWCNCLTALKDLVAHMRTGVFIGTCLFIGICRLRLWFFLSSFQQFMVALPKMDEESVKSYANYYGWVQLCSVAVGPFVSAFITAGAEVCKRSGSYKHQATSVLTSEEELPLDCECDAVMGMEDVSAASRADEVRGCTFYFVSSGLLFMLLNLLMVIPNAPLQIFTFILILLLRCFYTGAFSNLFLVVFPIKHFGKLYGIGNFSSSMVQMLQYPVFVILENVFPGKILQLNIVFLVLSIPLAIGFPYYLWHLANTIGSKARSTKLSTHACHSKVIIEKIVYERLTVV